MSSKLGTQHQVHDNMASITGPVGWASAEEWAANRDIITNLYIDEKKKLKEVIRIMRDEHNFHAT